MGGIFKINTAAMIAAERAVTHATGLADVAEVLGTFVVAEVTKFSSSPQIFW
jgi:hypothetical protein